MASDDLVSTLKDFVSVIVDLESLTLNSKEHNDQDTPEVTQQNYFKHYHNLLQLISTHSTRLTIALRPPYSKSTAADSKAVLKTIGVLAEQLVAHTLHLRHLDPFPGRCLCLDIQTTTIGVLHALSQLAQGFISSNSKKFFINTGLVWDVCDVGFADTRMSDLPRTNKSSVYKRAKTVLQLVRDVLFELNELVNQREESHRDGDKAECREDEDEDDSDFFDLAEDLTKKEKQDIINIHIPLIKLLIVLLRNLCAYLSPAAPLQSNVLTNDNFATTYDEILPFFENISSLTDDYVSSLHPSQDLRDVSNSSKAWVNQVKPLWQKLKEWDSDKARLYDAWNEKFLELQNILHENVHDI